MAPELDIKEKFARFFEKPSRDKLREMLRNQTGEYDFFDFKEEWQETSKLAKDILAFTNSGNGCIVVGVAENNDGTFDAKGLKKIIDKTELKEPLNKYLPDTVSFEIHDFDYKESEYEKLKGKSFQVLFVEHNSKIIPVLSLADGASLSRNRIYVRKDNRSAEADHDAVQKLINDRLAAEEQPEDKHGFDDHLSQLYLLYERKLPPFAYATILASFDKFNDYYRFINRMISKKQQVIEKIIEFKD